MRLRLCILLLSAMLVVACAPTTTPAATTDRIAQTSASDGNPQRGEALFRTYVSEARYACVSCHLPDSTQALLGPGLQGIGGAAAKCDPAQGTEDYLRESLVAPDACIAPGYTAGVMPAVYATVWSEKEVNDLVAWLLTLRQPDQTG